MMLEYGMLLIGVVWGKTMKDNCEAPSTAPSVSCTRNLNATAPQTTPQGSQESSCQRQIFWS